MILHQSHLKTFFDCYAKYYYMYVMLKDRDFSDLRHLNTLFGMVAHRVVSDLHADVSIFRDAEYVVAPMLLNALNEIEETAKRDENLEFKWGDRAKEEPAFIDDFSKAIVNYSKAPWNDPDLYTLTANELEFHFKINRFEFAGRVDQRRQYHDNDNAWANLDIELDLKTGKETFGQDYADRDIQRSMYALAMHEENTTWHWIENYYRTYDEKVTTERIVKQPKAKIPDEMWIYDLRKHIPYKKAYTSRKTGKKYTKGDQKEGSPILKTKRTKAHVERFRTELIIACRSIDMSGQPAFLHMPRNTMGCGNCPVKDICSHTLRGELDSLPTPKEMENIFEEAGVSLEDQLVG